MMFTKGDIKVDIIAAFSTEGEIIPLKIRFPDDNGCVAAGTFTTNVVKAACPLYRAAIPLT